MSSLSKEANFDRFLIKHRKDKEKIFYEIYSFLGNTEFKNREHFRKNYVYLLSKERNRKKVLPSGLILKISNGYLQLKDEESSFKIHIDYIKKVTMLNNKINKFQTKYIISETYYSYYYRTIKKNQIKYKFKDKSEHSSIFSQEFEKKIIFNDNLDYIILNPDIKQIYDKIYNIRKEEKKLDAITSKDLFNDFRILNFPDVEKNYIDKIELQIYPFQEYCWGYRYLLYNKKIGLTLAIQKYLIILYQMGKKYFYCNIDFLTNESDNQKIKNYIFFYVSFLFSDEEHEQYQNFIENNLVKLNYSQKREKLILDLLELLYSNFGNNFRLYFDNIKSLVQFDIINTFLANFYMDDVFALIQINKNTLYCLSDIRCILIDKLIVDKSIKNEMEYYIPYTLGKIDIKKIKEEYSEKLEPLFKDFNYESYLYLLNVKYLINSNDFSFQKLKDIKPFIDFLHVVINRNKVVNKIFFRNEIIEELFNDYYMNYILKFKNINNNIFFEISKAEEGINFERQIIFDMIIQNINIQKIKVNKIFSIKSFPDINYDNKQEYLFLQETSNAPCYDIGYLYYNNGQTIFKVCQIGINKPDKELKKLDKQFIMFDLSYFCQKIMFEKKIKIDKIDFCIITTFNAFLENEEYNSKKILGKERKYPNFNNMKNYCDENNFTFLIFDIKTSNFYSYDKDNKIVKSDLKFCSNQYDIEKIFIKNKYIKNTEKIEYTYDPKVPHLLGGLKLPEDFHEEYLNKEYNFKIVDNIAKYSKNEKEIENNDVKEEKIIENKKEEKLNKKRKRDIKFSNDNKSISKNKIKKIK